MENHVGNKSKKETAQAAYEAILRKVLEVDVNKIDKRHYKDILKVALRLYSHFSDPKYDEGIDQEMVRANNENFEIHHPNEISSLAEDLIGGSTTLVEAMEKAKQKIITSKENHREKIHAVKPSIDIAKAE